MSVEFTCPVCKSVGFQLSVTLSGCTFCDGTEGGNPPIYGAGFSDEELREHYEALVEDLPPELKLTREDMIDKLKGTEFDEHAYTYHNR